MLSVVLDSAFSAKGTVAISYPLDCAAAIFNADDDSKAIFQDVAAALGRICTILVHEW